MDIIYDKISGKNLLNDNILFSIVNKSVEISNCDDKELLDKKL